MAAGTEGRLEVQYAQNPVPLNNSLPDVVHFVLA